MSIEQELNKRSESKCELCSSSDNLQVYIVPPTTDSTVDNSVLMCATCLKQIENSDSIEANHWRCLNDSMWSQVPAVQVMAWRMLNRLQAEDWAQSLLDMLYLEDNVLEWAKYEENNEQQIVKHIDSNGATLATGNTVVLIKDLDVKGANFTAKRGTAVRNIRLVEDNAEHIEGRVSGQQIVILTKYVKKQ